jgi:hypothetical protein
MSDIFAIHCWIRGTEIHESFVLNISPLETVHALKTMIKNCQELDMAASALRLFKPHEPVAEPHDVNLGNLQLSTLGAPLRSSQQMSDLFNEPPQKGYIHIIVGMLGLQFKRGNAINHSMSIL